MKVFLSDWTFKEKEDLCTQPWTIDGDDDWYRNGLYCGDLKLDDWTYTTLVEAVDKDVKEGLSVMEILTKYLKEVDE